jgi:predicted  nucleic acid-binding Zn-ribbon protein
MTMPKPDVEFLRQEINRLRGELSKANLRVADFENLGWVAHKQALEYRRLWLAAKDDVERQATDVERPASLVQLRRELESCRSDWRATYRQMEDYRRLWLAAKEDFELFKRGTQ